MLLDILNQSDAQVGATRYESPQSNCPTMLIAYSSPNVLQQHIQSHLPRLSTLTDDINKLVHILSKA